MRRLRDYQTVALEVPEVQATCRIVAVGGGEAVLEPEFPRELAHTTLPTAATLGFEAQRHPVMLAGMAAAGPIDGTLTFWVTDAIGQRELRLRPRLAASIDIVLRPLDAAGTGGSAVTRQTVDLSGGGALVGGHRAEPGSLATITMDVPGLGTTLTCTARAVRQLPVGVAFEFQDLEADVERRLDQLIFAVRQKLARRAFAAPSPAANAA